MTKLVNKIILLNERRTSMRLCLKEWDALKDVCQKEKINRNKLIELIENKKQNTLGLSYSTRLFLLLYYKGLIEKSLSKGRKSTKENNGYIMSIIDAISK